MATSAPSRRAAARVVTAPVGQPSGNRPGRRSTPWLFLAPYLCFFGLFVLGPALFGLYVSLFDWHFTFPNRPFVGLDNYVKLFTPGTRDFEPFWRSMGATGTFTLLSVPLLVTLPLGVALLVNRPFRGRTAFRAIFFAPYVLGVAVVGVLWRFMLDTQHGIVNKLLGMVGLPDTTPWLQQLPWAWVSLVGATLWWTLGFNAIIYLAGLQAIPRDQYEAAELDGAGRWAQLRHVTLPGLRPVIVFIVMITVLASANLFGQSYIMTAGDPNGATRSAIMYMSETGLGQFRMGAASAMSYVLAVVLMVVSLLNFRFLAARRDDS
ncbi:carbohydrate ABC transporter permease [Sanguibacter suaedae]|uniref:Sugar ABC transporter permease n=1 Tax=Sanguibacter suaedae TaxID=2795737 RepID=A0A934M6K2_9MICO|nr:sugar ABC transporter permease [Sanguibacter suaedae]MBI9114342.1 sugar ABC transporter permease [Sanguibacter suaedae]